MHTDPIYTLQMKNVNKKAHYFIKLHADFWSQSHNAASTPSEVYRLSIFTIISGACRAMANSVTSLFIYRKLHQQGAFPKNLTLNRLT